MIAEIPAERGRLSVLKGRRAPGPLLLVRRRISAKSSVKQICEKYGVVCRDQKRCTVFTHLFVGRPGTGTFAEGTQVVPTSVFSVPPKRRRIDTKSNAGVFDLGFAS